MIFDEPYIHKYGYEIVPKEKISVLIDLSIIVHRLEYTEDRVTGVVAMGNRAISTHYGDSEKEVMEAMYKWVHRNFRVPDSVTFYYRYGPGS